MPTSPLVTVVIPTRDRQPLLALTLASVLEQQAVDLEVVVVIDGGTDSTADHLASVGDDRVTVLQHPTSLGVSRARNAGVAVARGAWIAFLDDDDLWAPDKLRTQLDALTETGGELCCVSSVKFDSTGRLGAPQHVPSTTALLPGLLRGNLVPGGASGVVASRALVERTGGFDPALSSFADWDMWIRFATTAAACHVDRPLVAYRVHPASMSHDVEASRSELALLRAKHVETTKRYDQELGGRELEQYFATQHMRAGRPLRALRTYAPLVRRGHYSWKVVAGMVLTALRPARQARNDAHAAWQLPPGWADEVLRWLSPLLVSGDHAVTRERRDRA